MKIELHPEPIGEHIIVVPDPVEKVTASGIEVPTGYRPNEYETGVVAAAGPGRLDNGVRVAPTVKRGDRVAYPEFAGTKFKFGDAEFRVMIEDDIFFRLIEREVESGNGSGQ